MRHVEHPGPYMSIGPGEAETQAEHPQVPQHFKKQINKNKTQKDCKRLTKQSQQRQSGSKRKKK